MNRALRVCLAAFFACAFCLGLAFHTHFAKSYLATAGSTDQGCVNQGQDRRIGATVVCWAQRRLSWKSDDVPEFMLIGNAQRTNLGLAWPPYLVYNSPDGSGHWRMFRIGFRYDRNWRGYIFPTVAWKRLSNPLQY
jgi:hypothetical protein